MKAKVSHRQKRAPLIFGQFSSGNIKILEFQSAFTMILFILLFQIVSASYRLQDFLFENTFCIFRTEDNKCLGSLIGPQKILTTATCILDTNNDGLFPLKEIQHVILLSSLSFAFIFRFCYIFSLFWFSCFAIVYVFTFSGFNCSNK